MISIKDLFQLAIKNMKYQKKRTALTILGIIIGISSVVALVSIGQGRPHKPFPLHKTHNESFIGHHTIPASHMKLGCK